MLGPIGYNHDIIPVKLTLISPTVTAVLVEFVRYNFISESKLNSHTILEIILLLLIATHTIGNLPRYPVLKSEIVHNSIFCQAANCNPLSTYI